MKKNIILVGFMGTGKTVVGKIVAEKLKMQFIDTDKIIEEKEKDRIPRIFQVKGEEYFREVEEKVVEEVSKKENCVISAGGGAIIREKNFNNLKRNGIIICLEAEPSIILLRTSKTEDRPLLLKNKDVISTISAFILTHSSTISGKNLFIFWDSFSINSKIFLLFITPYLIISAIPCFISLSGNVFKVPRFMKIHSG